MIVAIIGDEYEGYWLDDDVSSWSTAYKIDITQKFWERYKAFRDEEDFINCKLHNYYKDCKEQEIIKKSKDGIKPVGF